MDAGVRATSSARSGMPPRVRRSPGSTYSRSAVNWADFLERVQEWVPQEVERVYAIVDNLSMHRAPDVLLFSLAYQVGVRVPAAVCRLSESDRAVVEGAQEPCPQGQALRETLGAGVRGSERSYSLLEQAPAPLHVGQAPTAQAPPQARHRRDA